MTAKRKLKYGFHYTWKGILPKSEVIVVHATDLEDARTIARAKVKKLYPDVTPGCHWITMPQDFDRKPPRGLLAETAQQAECKRFRRTTIKIILIVGIVALLVALLTSCTPDRFIQCNKNFRNKITSWEQRITGAKIYHLQPIPSKEPHLYRLPDSTDDANITNPWESPVPFHP